MFLKISIISILLGGLGILSGLLAFEITPIDFAIKYLYNFLIPIEGVLISISGVSFLIWCAQLYKELFKGNKI